MRSAISGKLEYGVPHEAIWPIPSPAMNRLRPERGATPGTHQPAAVPRSARSPTTRSTSGDRFGDSDRSRAAAATIQSGGFGVRILDTTGIST